MTDNPEDMIELLNNSVVILCVLSFILAILIFFTFCLFFYPKLIVKFSKWVRRVFGVDKVVNTVYSDKTKNYSGTEFLPVPMKAPTDSIYYEFLGWNKYAKDKSGNFVIEPIFLKKIKKLIVNVYDEKDNLIETQEIEYGAGINLRGKVITKASTNEFEYEFVGWDKETKAFFENTEIHPVFKAKPIKYSYKFVMDDGKTIIKEKKAIYGTPISTPTPPAKIDDEFIYEFAGWKNYKRNMVLDKNYIFEAIFEKKTAKSFEDKNENEKMAIEIVLNDFKPKKQKQEDASFELQDNQNFKATNKINIESNRKPISVNKNKSSKINTHKKTKSILNGAVVESNQKKSKTK